MQILLTIVALLVVLGIVVFVHELGHFLAARWAGVRVDTFSIGFGPAIVKWHDKRGTLWKIACFHLWPRRYVQSQKVCRTVCGKEKGALFICTCVEAIYYYCGRSHLEARHFGLHTAYHCWDGALLSWQVFVGWIGYSTVRGIADYV